MKLLIWQQFRMILQKEIIENSRKFKVPPVTIDKDWVLGHLLNGIASVKEINELFIFKGGTCLHKCYFETYRFSEDLDFTLLDEKFDINNSSYAKCWQLAVGSWQLAVASKQ